MTLWPPYAAIYDREGANLHSSIGYHPVWSPPSPGEAHSLLCERLSANPTVDQLAVERMRDAADPVASVSVILNKVKLTFQVVLLLIVTASLVLIIRRRVRPV